MYSYTYMYVFLSLSLSFTPPFFYPFLSIKWSRFGSTSFLFYFLTRLCIHVVQNSKGIKEDSVKTSSAAKHFSLQATNVNSFLCIFLEYCLPPFYANDHKMYYIILWILLLSLNNLEDCFILLHEKLPCSSFYFLLIF